MPSSSNIAKRVLRRLANNLFTAADKISPNELNLMGDRDIEWSRMLSRMRRWPITEETYWIKQPSNQWLSVSRQEAPANRKYQLLWAGMFRFA